MTYRQAYDEVIASGKYPGRTKKLEALAQIIFNNDRTQDKEDCVALALEWYEGMTGNWFDPARAEYDGLVHSIIG